MKDNNELDLYVKLINHLPIGAAIMSPEGKTLFMNDAYRCSIDESEDFIYQAELSSPEYLKKISNSIYMKTVKSRRETRGSQLYTNEDNALYRVMLHDKPIFDENNELIAVLACAESIMPMGRADDVNPLLEAGSESSFIFESAPMRAIVERISRIAKLPVTILLMGESGVGKDRLAEYIHSLSTEKQAPFVTVNCAAIAENLIESELFGYESGAFTGAGRSGKKGLIEEANGGTLFLDEINSLPLALQGKLLRVIETKMVRRVGGTKEYKVDFRLICASNRDLEKSVQEGSFREDLYYRINVFTEVVPPLRERREDIIPLLKYFLRNFEMKYNIHCWVSDSDMESALNYDWPGNVRELRNFAEQMVVFGSGPQMTPAAIAAKQQKTQVAGTLKERLAQTEKEIIAEALHNNPTKRQAAQELGIDPAVLTRKIAKYGLESE